MKALLSAIMRVVKIPHSRCLRVRIMAVVGWLGVYIPLQKTAKMFSLLSMFLLGTLVMVERTRLSLNRFNNNIAYRYFFVKETAGFEVKIL
jgi:hypothetical protein